MAKAGRQEGPKGAKKKEKRNVPHGVAHIQATFNNTIVSIADPEGNLLSLVVGRPHRVQGLAQGHAVRGPGGGAERRHQRQGRAACARWT